MISEKEVKHIAKLARLGLTGKEIKKFQKELSSILDYFEKLKEVDVSKIEPTSHSIRIENVMKEDYYPRTGAPATREALASRPTTLQPKPTRPKIEKVKKLLDLMPETKDGYLKVKSVL